MELLSRTNLHCSCVGWREGKKKQVVCKLTKLLLSHCSICWSEQDSTGLCCTKHSHTPSPLVLVLSLLYSLHLPFLPSCSFPIYIQGHSGVLISAVRQIVFPLFLKVHYSNNSYLPAVTDEDTVKRYYAKFEEKFFQTCEKELAKINTFYSGNDYNNTTAPRTRSSALEITHLNIALTLS